MSEISTVVNGPKPARPCRISQQHEFDGKTFTLREACEEDAVLIKNLFDFVYNGKYPDNDLHYLAEEIHDQMHNLWMVAETGPGRRVIGCMMIKMDPVNRIGKAGRGLVLPEYRKGGLACTMLRLGLAYLCDEQPLLDVVYGTSRTVCAGPMRMMAEAGMKQMGVFPNAVMIETMEHLNLDLYLARTALEKRRNVPSIIAPFKRVYELAMSQLGLDENASIVEVNPMPPSRRSVPLYLNQDQADVAQRFHAYSQQERIAHSFFPFHFPNAILASEDGSTEVFIWYEGEGRRAAVVGYRSERKNIHEILRAVSLAMEAHGAAYLELLVPVHDALAQQSAYAARFIACAYFPAMRLSADGMRDDFFVLSRTFRLLDFADVVISPLNAQFLRAYMTGYYHLYIEPILGPLPPHEEKLSVPHLLVPSLIDAA